MIGYLVGPLGTPASTKVVIQEIVSPGVIRCRLATFSGTGIGGVGADLSAYSGGTLYLEAQLGQERNLQDIPVPAVNSVANVYQSDVIGNKSDDEDGSSLYSRAYKADLHDHSVAHVYPTMANGVSVTKNASPWTLGSFAVIIPAGTITNEFDIHGVGFDSVPDNGTFEVVLYAGADGGEVEIGRTRFTRTSPLTIELESPFQTPLVAANSQIKAKLAGSNSSASTVVMSVRYHTY
jgi:hypothetical protein